MAALKVRRLWTEHERDRSLIHAELVDGTVRRAYRVKSTIMTAEWALRNMARERGMQVRQLGSGDLEAVKED